MIQSSTQTTNQEQRKMYKMENDEQSPRFELSKDTCKKFSILLAIISLLLVTVTAFVGLIVDFFLWVTSTYTSAETNAIAGWIVGIYSLIAVTYCAIAFTVAVSCGCFHMVFDPEQALTEMEKLNDRVRG